MSSAHFGLPSNLPLRLAGPVERVDDLPPRLAGPAERVDDFDSRLPPRLAKPAERVDGFDLPPRLAERVGLVELHTVPLSLWRDPPFCMGSMQGVAVSP